MRIARIIEYFPPHSGGMERHALILSKEQTNLGHEVDVYIGYGDDKLLPNIYKMPFQFLPIYSKLRRFWFNIWVYFSVRRNHKANPYDIIHLHGDIIEARLGLRLTQEFKAPVIATIHGGLNPRVLVKSNGKIFNGLDHIICVSEEIKNSLLMIGVSSANISVISSGVYLSDFNKPKLHPNHSKPIIISVGTLTHQKGFDYLINAFKSVRANIPASLLIVGDGPERKNLERISSEIGGVYFFGELAHEKVIDLLLGSDLFTLASVTMPGYYEGTPTSLMEAMAAGLPIVTTKSGGIPYLIKENINGLLVEEKNSKMLAEAIIKLISNESLRRDMTRNNLEDIRQKDWPIIAKQILEIYRRCLNR